MRTATYNADVGAFFSKWLTDVADAQLSDGRFTDVCPDVLQQGAAPAWADAGVICPWTFYEVYGDKRVLERQYPSMVRWVEWCRANSTELIRDKARGKDYGDWLAIGATTSKELIGTAYFAHSADLLSRSAGVLGKMEDARKYRELFEQIRGAFGKKYIGADGRMTGGTQTGYLLALRFGLMPTHLREKAAEYLEEDIKAREYHVSTGFVGVSYMLPMLTAMGRKETAFRLLMQETFPSWLFSVKNGATTIWERWDGWTPEKGFQTPSMNSFNHYSLGSCGEWLFESVAGIGMDPAQPGFKHIVIRPQAGGGLTWAKGRYRSIRGEIASAWTLEGGRLTLKVEIPANTTARVHVPAAAGAVVREGGRPLEAAPGVKEVQWEVDGVACEVGSGSYEFTVGG
jgi:alpha-L-rhamnosidase